MPRGEVGLDRVYLLVVYGGARCEDVAIRSHGIEQTANVVRRIGYIVVHEIVVRTAERIAHAAGIGSIQSDPCNAAAERVGRLSACCHGDGMALAEQLPDELLSEEPCASNDEDIHLCSLGAMGNGIHWQSMSIIL